MENICIIIDGARVTFMTGGEVALVELPLEFQTDQTTVKDKDMKKEDQEAQNTPTTSAPSTSTIPHESEEICEQCWGDFVDPVQMSCGHTFCRMCVEHRVIYGNIPLRCVHDDCHLTVPLSDLQSHLTSQAFTSFLEASFRKYILRHPTEFANCPMRDCTTIFRITGEEKVVFCTSCQLSICRPCNTQTHEGIACIENQASESYGGNALEIWKRENGDIVTRKCPRCKVTIEKDGGCSDVTCAVCETSMCWDCGKETEQDENNEFLPHNCEEDEEEEEAREMEHSQAEELPARDREEEGREDGFDVMDL